MDNNLTSFIQLSKLECLPVLKEIVVENNDVIYNTLFKCFIVYRFPQVTHINGEEVTDNDKSRAR